MRNTLALEKARRRSGGVRVFSGEGCWFKQLPARDRLPAETAHDDAEGEAWLEVLVRRVERDLELAC